MDTINGKHITRANTIDSMYAKNHIELTSEDGTMYKIHADELLKMIQRYSFTIEKRVKHSYLTACMPEGNDGNNGYFSIARLHRDDLEAEGYDADNVTDETMKEIASILGDTCIENVFWPSLRIIADDLGIKKI